MTRETARHPSWKGRSIKIATANPGELEKRLREAVTAARTSFLKRTVVRLATRGKIGSKLNRTCCVRSHAAW
jgi:hypothetical protein